VYDIAQILAECSIWRANYKEGMPVLTLLDREIDAEHRNGRKLRATKLRTIRDLMRIYIDRSDR